ncbi:MAG: 3-phosphoshikimate 1-carboxyvinyltransferase [Tannerella sp.]|jgi:3-phosphoshikimate 1-carboxyvinyltransferase|nr:3-phosphoshikimate 1-carboxyvinyltransferase [Tannerella sp.]
MNYLIKASYLKSTSVHLPASKSISNRILLLNALSGHPQEIKNVSDCDDTKVMLKALHLDSPVIDIKAAGTAMRFLTAYLSGTPGTWTVTGTERMKNRPVKILAEALRALGAQIAYVEKEGYPPLRITGKVLDGGEISLDGSVSSQYISALLMIAPLMKHGLKLHLTGETVSKPYLRLTIELMKQSGVTVSESGQSITVPPQTYSTLPFTVESDWSAASYWYELAALSGNPSFELLGLFSNSLQGDAVISSLFEQLGIETTRTPSGILIKKRKQIQCSRLDYDFTDIPDMAQTLAVTCTGLHIPFRFSGLQSLKIKETDRLLALQTELRKFGYVLTVHHDSALEWNGERCEPEKNPVIATYEDHRMAMAFAPMAIRFTEGIKMADIDVVSKSYPNFWDDLNRAGFQYDQTD